VTLPVKPAALAGATILALAAGPVRAADSLVFGERGLSYESPGGAVRLDLGGRLQLDDVNFDQPPLTVHALDFRQARAELTGEVGERFEFRIEREFSSAAGVGWRNLWAGYRPFPDIELKAGNFIVPFSLEELQSYSFTPFMERSLANALSDGMGLGADASLHRDRWTATIGWFGDPIRNDDGHVRQRGDGLVARVTFLPVSQRDGFAHLGAAFERRTLDVGQTLQVQTGPETAFAPILISSQGLARADHLANFGFEAAWSRRSLLLQGQAIETVVGRAGAPDEHLRGGYVLGGWVLTGQGYDYNRSSGIVRGVAVPSGGQALELAARYSVLDLNSATARGGLARDLTLGVNWYLGRNFRITGDFVRSQTLEAPLIPSRKARVFALRLQAAF
jgi:phosphate-selective porin OprO/OprP